MSPILARLLDVLQDGAPTISELAELLALDKSSTSGLADRAQRRGLVRRVQSQLDRRAVRVRLTADGRGMAQGLRAAQAQDLAALLGPLPSADRQALLESLSRILAANTHQ